MACVWLSPQSRRCGKVLAEMGLSVDLTWKSHQSSRRGLHTGFHGELNGGKPNGCSGNPDNILAS